jgi:hypothetical protein
MPAGRPKNSKEVGRKIRTIVDRSLDILAKRKNVDVAELLADEMEEHGITATVPKFASFYPKEVYAEVDHSGTVSVSAEEVTQDEMDFIRNLRAAQEARAPASNTTH